MSGNPIQKQHHATFESIRHLDEAGREYWWRGSWPVYWTTPNTGTSCR